MIARAMPDTLLHAAGELGGNLREDLPRFQIHQLERLPNLCRRLCARQARKHVLRKSHSYVVEDVERVEKGRLLKDVSDFLANELYGPAPPPVYRYSADLNVPDVGDDEADGRP